MCMRVILLELILLVPATLAAQERPSSMLVFSQPRGADATAAELARPTGSPLRRAQIYVQRGDAIQNDAMARVDDAIERGDDDARRAALDALDPAMERAREQYAQAATVLEQSLRERPRPYSRETGVAMWMFLHTLTLLEDDAAASRIATTFVAECASCPHAADASVYLGDRAFAEMSMEEAAAHYEAALSVRRAASAIRGYAAYKLAWVHINGADHDRAWEALRQARRLSPALRDETARDAVRVMMMLEPFDPQRALNAAHGFADDRAAYDALLDELDAKLRRDRRDSDAAALAAAR